MTFISKNTRIFNCENASSEKWFTLNRSKLRSIEECTDGRSWCCSEFKRHEYLIEIVTEKDHNTGFNCFKDFLNILFSLFQDVGDELSTSRNVIEAAIPKIPQKCDLEVSVPTLFTGHQISQEIVNERARSDVSRDNDSLLIYAEKIKEEKSSLRKKQIEKIEVKRQHNNFLCSELAHSEQLRRQQFMCFKRVENTFELEKKKYDVFKETCLCDK